MTKREIADKIVFTYQEIAELEKEKSQSNEAFSTDINKKKALIKELVKEYSTDQGNIFEEDKE